MKTYNEQWVKDFEKANALGKAKDSMIIQLERVQTSKGVI